jgi:hypothetical protein
LLLAAKTRL